MEVASRGGCGEPMVEVSSFSLTQYAQEAREQIDASLRAYTDLGEGCPEPLREAMQYALLAPGKRLRPMLVLMAAEACGGTVQTAMPAACAVEMIHAYSLVHDDLPAMDDDDLRRGRPTCHKRFGEAMAILAGDALLTLAFEVVARGVRPPERAAACAAVLAEAAGACQLVGGQADDIRVSRATASHQGRHRQPDRSGRHPDRSGRHPERSEGSDVNSEEILRCAQDDSGQARDGGVHQLEWIHRRKTGAMIRASLRLGAIVSGADASLVDLLDRYGERIGLAFQITDDLLDVRGTEATMGKRVRKDADRGKLTFPGLLGVEESVRRAEQLIAAARDAIRPFGSRAEGLDAIARYVLERSC